MPSRLDFLLRGVKSGVLRYYTDNQYKKDEYDEQVPIIEKHLPDDAKRHLVGVAEHFQEVDGEVLPEEMETYYIDEIQ